MPFLQARRRRSSPAICEFHGPQIKDAIEACPNDGATLTLVMDNATFSIVEDERETFDRLVVFRAWEEEFEDKFERIVVPEGPAGLISNAP